MGKEREKKGEKPKLKKGLKNLQVNKGGGGAGGTKIMAVCIPEGRDGEGLVKGREEDHIRARGDHQDKTVLR